MRKNLSFLRKAGLCLGLLFALAASSCSTSRDFAISGGTWYLQATLVPGCYGLDDQLTVAPVLTTGQPPQLTLCYRLQGRQQAEEVRNQLLATGLVQTIKITPQ